MLCQELGCVTNTFPGPHFPSRLWLDAFPLWTTVPTYGSLLFPFLLVSLEIFLSFCEVSRPINITSYAVLSYFVVIEESSWYLACHMARVEITPDYFIRNMFIINFTADFPVSFLFFYCGKKFFFKFPVKFRLSCKFMRYLCHFISCQNSIFIFLEQCFRK